MNWIRIAVGIMDDPSVVALAEAVGVSVVTTTGHLVGLLTHLPEGAANGDVSAVSDVTLERWADWRGRKGKFATAFRAQLCDAQGVVRSWEKHNGAAIREVERARERAKERRKEWKASHERSPNVGVTSPERSRLRDETRRDETNYLTTTTNAVAVATRSRGLFPHFDKAVCDAAYERWQSKCGAVNYGRFRKAFGPLFAQPEAARPAAYPRDAELVPALSLYLDAVYGARESAFKTVERCAASLSGIVATLRETTDGERRLLGAQLHLGILSRGVAA